MSEIQLESQPDEGAVEFEQLPEKGQGIEASPQPVTRRVRMLENILRVTTYVLLAVILGLVAMLARDRFFNSSGAAANTQPEDLGLLVQPELSASNGAQFAEVELAPLVVDPFDWEDGIVRKTLLQTTIPTRARVEVVTYTVQTGDTLFKIADNFGLKPETILWGNFDVLEDNPHLLRPNQVLNILPVDGTYYQWHEGDSIASVAEFFKADPQDILEFSGNRFDLTEVSTASANIEPGTWLIIPGGSRELRDWGPPMITRSNPASARYYGAGHCGSIYTGAVGVGIFVWPTTERRISGYDYRPGIHPAIDIAGAEGNPVYATDSGVVVYAGWSNYGYGNLVVIDHGNGWQSAYAHLSSYSVGCGLSVFQGGFIGAVGNTGNSYGAHLHFELVYGGAKLNPLDFLQ
jgi:murein DD-endopeptidase MepM/ murein hydrolase activator NlpD